MNKFMTMIAITLFLASPALAQNQPWWEKYRTRQPELQFFSFMQRLTFSGDFRVRNDAAFKSGLGNGAAGSQHRSRNRFRNRLRLGTEVLLPWDLTINTRLATGTGEQTSTNQSYDNLGSQKQIWVDQMFVRWFPIVSQEGNGTFYAQTGRMTNPLWRLYSSDLIWDEDFNPEGFATGGEWLLPNGMIVFANALQSVADEDSNTPRNQWLFSQQAGLETRLPFETRLRTAAAYHIWTDTQRNSLSQTTVQDGNRRLANGTLANRFRVAELTSQLSGWAGQVPVLLQGTVARNVGAVGLNGTAGVCPGATPCPAAREGYQAGVIVGQAIAPGQWEAAFFKKYAESDVTVADVADSDFGDGGLNQKGYIGWVSYMAAEWMVLRAKFFAVRTLHPAFNPFDKNVRRLQLDMNLRF